MDAAHALNASPPPGNVGATSRGGRGSSLGWVGGGRTARRPSESRCRRHLCERAARMPPGRFFSVEQSWCLRSLARRGGARLRARCARRTDGRRADAADGTQARRSDSTREGLPRPSRRGAPSKGCAPPPPAEGGPRPSATLLHPGRPAQAPAHRRARGGLPARRLDAREYSVVARVR